MGQNILFKETEVVNNLTEIQECLNKIIEKISSYSATANCLGESTFRGSVEEQLRKLKETYSDMMIPPVKKLELDIKTVISGYQQSASEAENATM